MKLRTGLKALVGISLFGIPLAIYEIVTCPLAALLSFTIAERVGASDHQGHGAPISTLRGFPVDKSEVFHVEASFLVIPVFLAVIVFGFLILRQRRFHIIGVPITPQLMGLVVFLIGAWNLLFSGFLFVERLHRQYLF